MKIVIKNRFADLLAFGKHLKIREKLFAEASDQSPGKGEVNELSRRLHPMTQNLVIHRIREEAQDIRSYEMKPAEGHSELARFRAGQYVVLEVEADGLILKRPYSLSSSPSESSEGNFYRITMKRKPGKEDGFFSEYAFTNWKEGSPVTASDPRGTFYYEALRDGDTLVCIAGGSGITPFRSLIPDLLETSRLSRILLFYGYNSLPDAAFADDFRHLASEYPEGFRFFPISMESEGIITVDTIKRALKNSFEDVSFFICGPPALHDYILGVLESCSVRRKFIRRENFGRGSRDLPDPVPRYNLTLQLPAGERQISARSDETILTALERAGVNAPSSCRGGDCGFCRSRLVSGDITFDSTLTGVRLADRKFGWIHPCVSYPEGDLVIKVPENP